MSWKMKPITVYIILVVLLLYGCQTDSEDTHTPSYQERLDRLTSIYDETFISYLQQAEETMGKRIFTYSAISDRFSIPKQIEITGSHFELGQLLGHIARQQGSTPSRISENQRALNNEIIAMYREIYPRYLELVRGLGEVFGMPVSEMDFQSLEGYYFSNLWGDLLLYGAFNALGPAPSTASWNSGNCAMVSADTGNNMILGRNFDNDRVRPHFVVRTKLDGVYEVLANAQYTIYHWVMDGINEKGLVMATAGQVSPSEYYDFYDPYPDFPVIQKNHMFRVALETCATVDEVISLYQRVRPWCPDVANHLMVADASGNSVVIGNSLDRTPAFFPSTENFQVLTNTSYHMGHEYLMENCWRFRTATQMAEQGITGIEDIHVTMQAIKGDSVGYMSLYDINHGKMQLLLPDTYNTPWTYRITVTP